MAPSIEALEKELDDLLIQTQQTLGQTQELSDLETVRVKVLGRRGSLAGFFSHLREGALASDERARLGKKLNTLKRQLEQAVRERRETLAAQSGGSEKKEDLTLPGFPPVVGRLHPVTQAISNIVGIFRSLGFSVLEGPELETEHNNFEALNIPADHPSRESFDTFYLKTLTPTRWLLRSHTSPVQVRFMESHSPPFQIIVPGRVFRPDAMDASHSFQFHQVEGLAVGPGVSFGDLKGVLIAWARGTFGEKARLRFRPHYFPFTEPSAEVDLACIFCEGKGCRVCGKKGWLEILGCGMVHPAVFKAVGYLPGTVGFAFGLGVERIAMLLYGIEDIRLFAENDLRFLKQFP